MTKPLSLAAIALLAALAAAPAAAQIQPSTASRALPVTGNTPQVCAMNSGRIQPGALVNINGLDGDTLRILQLTDPQTLAARAASATVSFEAFCNFPHRVRIESQNNGLFPVDARISSANPAFASAVPYLATVEWDNASASLDANAKLRQLSQQLISAGGPAAGDLRLRVVIQQGASNVDVNAPLLAGTYADTLRIFLEPQ